MKTVLILGVTSDIGRELAKAGLNVLTQSLARVLAPEIRVNAVCPGWVDTPLLDPFDDFTKAAIRTPR